MVETSYVYIDTDPEYGTMPKVHILTPENKFDVPVYGYADVPKELADALAQSRLAWHQAEQAIIDYAKPIFEQIRQQNEDEWNSSKPARYAQYLKLLPKYEGHLEWDCVKCHGEFELTMSRYTPCEIDGWLTEWGYLYEEFHEEK
jgi:hypothetical protein